jgi:hypothetical protein
MKKLLHPRKENRIVVPAYPEEKSQIRSQAEKAGLSVAEYIRRVCIGYPVRVIFDRDVYKELLKAHADLNRLGGLFKSGLSQGVKGTSVERDVRHVLKSIEETSVYFRRVIDKLVMKI